MARCAWPASQRSRGAIPAAAVALLVVVAATPCARAQDRLSIESVLGLPGQTVQVRVYLRDVAGTTLDEGSGPDHEIQGFSFRANFPATWVTSVSWQQAGVTLGKTPVFTFIDPASDHITVLLSFDESTNPLVFTLNKPPPGDVIGNLSFGIHGSAPLGTAIPITVVADTATLSNHSGLLGETVANGMLAVGNGSIGLGNAIFANGFEGGSTCAWSARHPSASCI
jgi:hypothetical protein